jgi:divalent metal cation (Fe/Co/Zn/Cd) transporter
VAIESVRNLLTRETPETTLLGIGLTISSLLLMPALGVAKRRLGYRLSSRATAGEGSQNLLCAYLAGAVLVSLLGNSLWGWWWLDPVAGLLVAVVAIKEGREAWRGESCCATRSTPPRCGGM